MDEKFKKGAPGSEERAGTGYGTGEVRGSRDLTSAERSDLLSGYTTGGEDHGIEERREASSSFDRSGQSGAGYNVGGPSDIGGGLTAGATDTRSAGEFSGSSAIGGGGSAGGTGGGGIRESGIGGSVGVGATGTIGSGAGALGASSYDAGDTGTGSQVKEKASGAASKVKSAASEQAHKVAEKAKHQVDARKGEVADKIDEASSQLHEKLSGKADEYVGQVASFADQYLSRASKMLRERSSDELVSLAREEFRSRPLAVAAGFFALGFVGARLLRS